MMMVGVPVKNGIVGTISDNVTVQFGLGMIGGMKSLGNFYSPDDPDIVGQLMVKDLFNLPSGEF